MSGEGTRLSVCYIWSPSGKVDDSKVCVSSLLGFSELLGTEKDTWHFRSLVSQDVEEGERVRQGRVGVRQDNGKGHLPDLDHVYFCEHFWRTGITCDVVYRVVQMSGHTIHQVERRGIFSVKPQVMRDHGPTGLSRTSSAFHFRCGREVVRAGKEPVKTIYLPEFSSKETHYMKIKIK